MKRLSLILILTLSFSSETLWGNKFDVIITKTRMQIPCVITDENDSIITYKMLDTKAIKRISKIEVEQIHRRTEEPDELFSTLSAPNISQQTPKNNFSNDIIVLKNTTRIDAIVKEIEVNHVKYKNATNPDGPLYSVDKSDISVILYKNGETEVFNVEQKPTSSSHASTYNDTPDYRHFEQGGTSTNVDFPSGGIHTDANGDKRIDFAGGHRTVHADGSSTLEVPFVTINKKGDGGRGVEKPQTDDITGFQVIKFYGKAEDNIIIINKSSQTDYFKIAVCSVKSNHYFWRKVATTNELKPYNSVADKKTYQYKSEDKLEELLYEDKYVYSIAIMSRSGREYSYNIKIERDDLIIEVLDLGSSNSYW